MCSKYGNCKLSDVISDSEKRECPNDVVLNMSLGAPNRDSEWRSIRDAIKEAVDAGVFVAVAAGNEGRDACAYSPASSPDVCAAGASDSDDSMAMFSNYGKLIAVFAPGVEVLSTYINGSTVSVILRFISITPGPQLTPMWRLLSGTSKASPHVAGLGAYIMGLKGRMSPYILCHQLKELSTKDALSSIPSSSETVNYLAFNSINRSWMS